MYQMIKKIIILGFFPTVAFAQSGFPWDGDVADLKKMIFPFRSHIDTNVSLAKSTLKLKFLAPGTRITYDQCKAIEEKIEGAYKLSPVRLIFENGATFAQFCDWNTMSPSKLQSEAAKMEYYFSNISQENQFGIPVVFALKIVKPGDLTQTVEMLLTANYQIVERNIQSHYLHAVSDWQTTALDVNGNLYSVVNDGEIFGTNAATRTFFSSADGVYFGSNVIRPRRSDRGSERLNTRSYEVRQKDWLDFQLIMTYWPGDFYSYTSGAYQSSPRTHQSLYEVKIASSGQEVCADGNSKDGNDLIFYKPSNNQDPYFCSNVW